MTTMAVFQNVGKLPHRRKLLQMTVKKVIATIDGWRNAFLVMEFSIGTEYFPVEMATTASPFCVGRMIPGSGGSVGGAGR